MSDELEAIAAIRKTLPEEFYTEQEAVELVAAALHPAVGREWAESLLRCGAEKWWLEFSVAPTYLEADDTSTYNAYVVAYIIHHTRVLDSAVKASAWRSKSVGL